LKEWRVSLPELLINQGGDAVFNGRAGRVFRGLRPAAGCSGAEMGWGQSFSGSFR
jgi:hypothetical protein